MEEMTEKLTTLTEALMARNAGVQNDSDSIENPRRVHSAIPEGAEIPP